MVHLVFVGRPASASSDVQQAPEIMPAIVTCLHGGTEIGVTSFPYLSAPRQLARVPHVDNAGVDYVGPAWKWPEIV